MIGLMQRRWLLVGIGLAALLLIVTIVFATRRNPPVKPVKPAPVVAVPAPAPPPAEILLSGTVQAIHVVNVPPNTDGVIQEFLATVGESVAENQLLARIRSMKLEAAEQQARLDATQARDRVSSLEAALNAARLEISRSTADAARVKAELGMAEKAYQRQTAMWRDGLTPRLTYEKSEEDYKSLKSQSENLAVASKTAAERVPALSKEFQAAQQELEHTVATLGDAQAALGAEEVKANAAGLVIARRGEVGQPVDPSMTDLFTIATDLDALQVVLEPDAPTLERIHGGQRAVVQVAGDAPGHGIVRAVENGKVVVEFKSPMPNVRPGMSAQVKLVP